MEAKNGPKRGLDGHGLHNRCGDIWPHSPTTWQSTPFATDIVVAVRHPIGSISRPAQVVLTNIFTRFTGCSTRAFSLLLPILPMIEKFPCYLTPCKTCSSPSASSCAICGLFDTNSLVWCRESRVAIENMVEACLHVSSNSSQIVRARISLPRRVRFSGRIRGNTCNSSVASCLQICGLCCLTPRGTCLHLAHFECGTAMSSCEFALFYPTLSCCKC